MLYIGTQAKRQRDLMHTKRLLPWMAALTLGALPLSAQDAPEAETATVNLAAGEAEAEAAAAAFTKMVKERAEQDDYSGLTDELHKMLQSAFPEALKEDGSTLEDAKVKSKLGTRALQLYQALKLAADAPQDADVQKRNAFMKWLCTNSKKPASLFIAGITKNKVERADAVKMMAELREAFDKDPKKALTDIKGITNPMEGGVNKKFYPRQKKDIDSTVKKLLSHRDKGTPKVQQDAVNMVNVFRFLCGLSPTVTYDKTYHDEAQLAAETCRKAGKIDHGLGGNTDKCNLFQGQQDVPVQDVIGYMEDPGENNREGRGHRSWIMAPATGKTAFGVAGGFGAMRTSDHSCDVPAPENGHAYPGMGFFPSAYLYGDGWSYYAPAGQRVPDKPKVEMWKLNRSVAEPPKESQLTKANAVPIKAVFQGWQNSVTFEPDYSKFKNKGGKMTGTYWIRISWEGFKAEYVVDLY